MTAGPTLNQVLHRFAEFVWEMREESAPIQDDRELLRIARAARERITLGGPSSGYCAVVCVPLATYLTRRGLAAEDIHGAVGEWQHSWIALCDGRILDPTADQFNRNSASRMPPIYLGVRPTHYEMNSSPKGIS